MKRALFLDRDGVLNVDHGYVGHPNRFEVLPGVFEALREAQALGYVLIVVTNQSGIARGYFSEGSYMRLEEHVRALFAEQGIYFAAIYHCPHHPDGAVAGLAIACDCRKPRPGMLLRAALDHEIDLSTSIMIGDKPSDIEAAAAAGVGHSYLVGGDHGQYGSLAEFVGARLLL